MDSITRAFDVPPEMADEVRAVIAGRVWIQCTERRRWFWPFTQHTFTVSGLSAQVEALALELKAMKDADFEERVW